MLFIIKTALCLILYVTLIKKKKPNKTINTSNSLNKQHKKEKKKKRRLFMTQLGSQNLSGRVKLIVFIVDLFSNYLILICYMFEIICLTECFFLSDS